MQVHFQKDWYCNKIMQRFRKCESRKVTREVPDELRDHLPSTATIVSGGKREIEDFEDGPVHETLSMKDADTLRSAVEEADAVVQKAEAFREQMLEEQRQKAEEKKQRDRERMAKVRAARGKKKET